MFLKMNWKAILVILMLIIFLFLASAIFGDIITTQVRVKYSGFIVLVFS